MIILIDTTSLMKIFTEELGPDGARVVRSTADAIASVTLIALEAGSALATATRPRHLMSAQHAVAKFGLSTLLKGIHLISVDVEILIETVEVVEFEGLRSYDAVHLRVALLIADTVFSSVDSELCAAE